MSRTQKLFKEIHISKHPHESCVSIYLCKEARAFINSDRVVVDRVREVLRFRAASMMDNRTLKFYNGRNAFSYSDSDAGDFIGNWTYEIEGDYIYLENKIK